MNIDIDMVPRVYQNQTWINGWQNPINFGSLLADVWKNESMIIYNTKVFCIFLFKAPKKPRWEIIIFMVHFIS